MNTHIIKDIILSVLEDNDGCTMDNSQEREQVAQKVALALTLASLEQLAALMGTNLSYDSEGQVLLFTGVYDANKADEIAQGDLQANLAWEDEISRRSHERAMHKDFGIPTGAPPVHFADFASDDVDPTEVP